MQGYLTKGIICVKDELNIEYRVCIIEYLENEDGSFEYRFFPNYPVIDLLNSDVFQGIPGLNLELKEKVYVRKNILPVFISERVPSINREDYYEILDEVNMKFMEPIEFLIRSKQRYSGDHLYVIKYEERKKILINDIKGKQNSFGLIKLMLEEIAANNEVYLDSLTKINDESVFKTLRYIYKIQYESNKAKQKEGIEEAKKNNKYHGRKPVPIDLLKFYEVLEKVNNKEITNRKASEILGISIDKYYRYKKLLQNKNDTLLQ